MFKPVALLLLAVGLCLASAKDTKTETTTAAAATTTADDGAHKKETRLEKALDEDDDLVVIVAGAPSSVEDDVVVIVAGGGDAKEGRAIVVDGIPVDNAGPGQAGFKLLKADDVKNDDKNDKIKIVGDVPTDATDDSTAGFRLPKTGEQPRIIEVLVAEEEEDLSPGFRNASESVDDVIIIAVSTADLVDCFEERETGTCDKSEGSFYYDHEAGSCQFFVYSGCGGNSNRFSTLEECEDRCKDAKNEGGDKKKKTCGSLAPACEEDCALVQGEECLECSCKKVDPSVCTEAPGKKGVCRALLLYWTYHSDKNSCETFTFGGCDAGASKNRFKTKELCEATCVKKDDV